MRTDILRNFLLIGLAPILWGVQNTCCIIITNPEMEYVILSRGGIDFMESCDSLEYSLDTEKRPKGGNTFTVKIVNQFGDLRQVEIGPIDWEKGIAKSITDSPEGSFERAFVINDEEFTRQFEVLEKPVSEIKIGFSDQNLISQSDQVVTISNKFVD